MTAFAAAYGITWLAITAYIWRLAARQRHALRALGTWKQPRDL
jgi:CcmD family protein